MPTPPVLKFFNFTICYPGTRYQNTRGTRVQGDKVFVRVGRLVPGTRVPVSPRKDVCAYEDTTASCPVYRF
eukprot:1915345-Rhodomonas_salina.1